jgi:hypothetical protein
MVVHTCNSSTLEAEAGGSWVRNQPWLHSKICLEKQKQTSYLAISTLLHLILIWAIKAVITILVLQIKKLRLGVSVTWPGLHSAVAAELGFELRAVTLQRLLSVPFLHIRVGVSKRPNAYYLWSLWPWGHLAENEMIPRLALCVVWRWFLAPENFLLSPSFEEVRFLKTMAFWAFENDQEPCANK